MFSLIMRDHSPIKACTFYSYINSSIRTPSLSCQLLKKNTGLLSLWKYLLLHIALLPSRHRTNKPRARGGGGASNVLNPYQILLALCRSRYKCPHAYFFAESILLIAQCHHVGKRNIPQCHLSLLPLHKLVLSHLGDDGLQIYYHLIPCK